MKKMMLKFTLTVLCFFTFNVAVTAAIKENPLIQEIIREKENTDKEKLTVKTETRRIDGGAEEINYYYNGNELKKIVNINDYNNVVIADATNETEYYIKNGKVYFIYDKFTVIEYGEPIIDDKTGEEEYPVIDESIREKKYYLDFKGKLIRYVDEDGKIHENDSKMKEDYENFKINMSDKLKKYLKN